MKSATKVMYIIGRIVNIFEIILGALLIALGILCRAFKEEIAQEAVRQGYQEISTADGVVIVSVIMLIIGIIVTIIAIVELILASHASHVLNNDTTNNAPHIIMIIIGVFGNLFYLLGGVFGLVAENEENKKE